ncbi:MAG: NAD(P)H-hydrate dehydratase [Anaerolineales bacterium]|nr:NAD(P)H-hydrate dehydratase [Anaerolineales bacterium]
MKILTVAEMRAAESAADSAGNGYAEMMERAGRGAAEALLARLEDPGAHKIVVLAGSGNNGGDGLVCAHYLSNAGASVAVYLTRQPDEADPKVQRLRTKAMLVADAERDGDGRVLARLLGSATVVVDALVGTGARLPLAGGPAAVLDAMQEQLAVGGERPFVMAIDCPSGLECDNGACDARLTPADLTVTFAAPKRGFFGFPANDRLGELVVVDIGLDPYLPVAAPEVMDAERAAALLPERPRQAHKGTFGRALVIAGSRAYVGAAALAAEAAYRAGTGLVEVAPPESLWAVLAPQIPEAIWLPLDERDGGLAPGAAEQVSDALDKASAVLFGPGLGQAGTTQAFVARLLSKLAGRPGLVGRVLVDADGLRHLARVADWAERLSPGAVLTPHPGEFRALTGRSASEIQSDRIGSAQRQAQLWGHVVLLKGAFTVIAAPDGRTTVLPFAEPALARAGTGDVLSGLITGLLAQGLTGYDAACAAGWLHGRAAQLAANHLGTAASVLARDVLAAVPEALSEVKR